MLATELLRSPAEVGALSGCLAAGCAAAEGAAVLFATVGVQAAPLCAFEAVADHAQRVIAAAALLPCHKGDRRAFRARLPLLARPFGARSRPRCAAPLRSARRCAAPAPPTAAPSLHTQLQPALSDGREEGAEARGRRLEARPVLRPLERDRASRSHLAVTQLCLVEVLPSHHAVLHIFLKDCPHQQSRRQLTRRWDAVEKNDGIDVHPRGRRAIFPLDSYFASARPHPAASNATTPKAAVALAPR
mmetsp:Transcript_15069/g.48405  ORF Transcript_15069/g.48405 Transcript_15069/m.48405 type:complete len:246 (+) Transcript_15069:1003-1740(+)